MSAMRDGTAVKSPCFRYMVTGENITSEELAVERSVRVTKMVRSDFLEIPRTYTGSFEDGSEVAK